MNRNIFHSMLSVVPFTGALFRHLVPTAHWENEENIATALTSGVLMGKDTRPYARLALEEAGYVVKWEHWRSWETSGWYDDATGRFRIPEFMRYLRYSVRLTGPVSKELRDEIGGWPWKVDDGRSWLHVGTDTGEKPYGLFTFRTYAVSVKYPMWYSAAKAARVEMLLEVAISRHILWLIDDPDYLKPEGMPARVMNA